MNKYERAYAEIYLNFENLVLNGVLDEDDMSEALETIRELIEIYNEIKRLL